MERATVKTEAEIVAMRRAGQIVGSVLFDLKKAIRVGQTPRALDRLAKEWILDRGGRPGFLGYQNYPATLCISVNDAVVHGVPGDTPFAEGDVVGIDAGATVDGLNADAAITIGVGKISSIAEQLLAVTERALEAGIHRVAPGKPLGDVQAAIQAVIEEAGFGIITDLVGHGIGRKLHEPPQIPNVGRAGEGMILRPGMTICLEPMVTVGSPAIFIDPRDHWTVRTKDGSLAAQFEHTLLVTESGVEILTPIRSWPKNR